MDGGRPLSVLVWLLQSWQVAMVTPTSSNRSGILISIQLSPGGGGTTRVTPVYNYSSTTTARNSPLTPETGLHFHTSSPLLCLWQKTGTHTPTTTYFLPLDVYLCSRRPCNILIPQNYSLRGRSPSYTIEIRFKFLHSTHPPMQTEVVSRLIICVSMALPIITS